MAACDYLHKCHIIRQTFYQGQTPVLVWMRGRRDRRGRRVRKIALPPLGTRILPDTLLDTLLGCRGCRGTVITLLVITLRHSSF